MQLRALLRGIQASPLRALIPRSPRDHPEYNELWAACGMSAKMQLPRPYYRGFDNNTKYAVVTGQTAWTSVSLPADQTALIFIDELRSTGCKCEYTIGASGAPITATDWTANGMSKDRTESRGSGSVVLANWLGVSPQEFYEDSTLVDGEYTKEAQAGSTPQLRQCLGSSIQVRVTTTLNGLAEVRTLSVGCAPSFMGRRHGIVPTDTDASTAASSHHGLRDDLRGSMTRMFQASSSESPSNVMQRTGRLHMVPGAHSAVVHVTGAPEYGWSYYGQLKAATAPDGNFLGTTYNFRPRWNIAERINKHGAVLVINRSVTESLTIHFRCKVANAVVFHGDDAVSTHSALAAAAFKDAATLAPHFPPVAPPRVFFPAVVSATEQGAVAQHAMLSGHTPEDIPTSKATHDEGLLAKVGNGVADVAKAAWSGIKEVAEEIIPGVGAAQAARYLWDRAKAIPNRIEEIAPRSLSSVEESIKNYAPEAFGKIAKFGEAAIEEAALFL